MKLTGGWAETKTQSTTATPTHQVLGRSQRPKVQGKKGKESTKLTKLLVLQHPSPRSSSETKAPVLQYIGASHHIAQG